MRKPLKKIIYIDLDNTIVDFKSGIDACTQEELNYYKNIKKKNMRERKKNFLKNMQIYFHTFLF